MSTNPLIDELATQLAGVTIELPTGGIYYGSGVLSPDADVKEISVNVLSMRDEIEFRDPYLQATGASVTRLVSRICPQILDPTKLCDIDIEAIILASRIASYGDTMEVEVTCQNPEEFDDLDPDTGIPTGKKHPVCRHNEQFVANLTEIMFNYGPMTDLDKYTLILEPYGQTVVLRPLTHEMALRVARSMIQRGREIATLEKIENESEDTDITQDEVMSAYLKIVDTSIDLTVDTLLDAIHLVKTKTGNAITDKEMIREWLTRLPSEKVEEINKMVNTLIERTRSMSKVPYVCPECKYKQDVQIILDADKLFLSAPEPSVAPMKSSAISETSEKPQIKRSKSLPKSHTTTGAASLTKN